MFKVLRLMGVAVILLVGLSSGGGGTTPSHAMEQCDKKCPKIVGPGATDTCGRQCQGTMGHGGRHQCLIGHTWPVQ